MSSITLYEQDQLNHSASVTSSGIEEIVAEKKEGESQEFDELDLPRLRKFLIISVLCSAQFFDIFNANSVVVALPTLGNDLGFTAGALQWMLSAYTLTFAAFMLISGSIADIFHPKPVFCTGFAIVGLFSIPVGASVHPIMAIGFRAIQGIGAAMNVPSAISMIRMTFPDPAEQSRAYATYALFGTVGNVSGFVIGGVLTARTSWRWVFYLIGMMVVPASIASWLILPSHKIPPASERRSVDFPGVFSLTTGLILFVYAVSDGSDAGWDAPRVIVTLTLSVIVCAGFLVIEHFSKNPALPPSTWSNKNFIPLFFYAWSPYWWCLSSQLQLVEVFMDLWHDSALSAALRCLPLGIAGGISSYMIGIYASKIPSRILLIGGQLIMAVGSILFALADTPNKYWAYVVPGMIVGMSGLVIGYVACTAAVMDGARKGEEGVVGAVLYTAYQIGSTVGFAVVTSITTGVNNHQPISQHKGYAASFWSMVAMPGVMMIIIILFVRK